MLLTFGCGPKERPSEAAEAADTAGGREAVVEQTMPDSAYLQRGKAITAAAFKTLKGHLMKAMQEGGVSQALSVCAGKAPLLLDSLSEVHDALVRRVSHRPRNPANAADSFEVSLIQRYEAMRKAGEPFKPVLRKDDEAVTFYAPIPIAMPGCLRCHGTPGKDIAEEDYILIQQYYPQDQAVGFQMGDVRGLWKIVFPRQQEAI